MFKKLLVIFVFLFLFGLVGLVGSLTSGPSGPDFENLSPAEMHERIIKQRDYAIAKAVEAGDYRCCINPPCTMCYMEGNQWNNNEAGTCACDDLIAQGEDPCPQCLRGLCSIEDKDACNGEE